MNGWISLHRKMLNNPVVCKDSDSFAVWNYLLLNATHKKEIFSFNKQNVELFPGQVITGRKSISEKLNIAESKVQRILKSFEDSGQIQQSTNKKYRLITINNWQSYQYAKQQSEHLNNLCRHTVPTDTEEEEKKVNIKMNNNENNPNKSILEEENDEFEKNFFSKNRSIEYLELEAEYFEKTRAVPFARKIRLIAECKKTEKYKKLSEDEKYDLYVALIV